MIVIGNERIIRLGVSVTYDCSAAANRVLDKWNFSLSVNRSNACFVNLRHASNVNPGKV